MTTHSGPHPVTAHIDDAISFLPNPQFMEIAEAIRDLLTELHEDAASEGAYRTTSKIERIAGELGLSITHEQGQPR